MVRTARLAETISASTVECATEVCFWAFAARGKNEFGPTRARKTPEVDLNSGLSPAKSASAYSLSFRADGPSPMKPVRQ